jgi:hypothetical protein
VRCLAVLLLEQVPDGAVPRAVAAEHPRHDVTGAFADGVGDPLDVVYCGGIEAWHQR